MRWKNLTCRQCPLLYSRRIRRYRQNSKSVPPIPNSRYGYEIPEDYTVLHDGQDFLQYDSGVNDKNRFLIFASNQGLDDLLVQVLSFHILSVVHYSCSCSRNIHSATFCAAPQQSAAHVQLAL